MDTSPVLHRASTTQIMDIPLGLTFDDVLLLPQQSSILTRSECDVTTRFSKNIPLKVPIVSSPMDCVTEYEMAREMAKHGGLGVIHRFMSIDDQAQQVEKVKRSSAHVIMKPYIIHKDTTKKKLRFLIQEKNVNTFLVTADPIDELDDMVSPRRKYSNEQEEDKLYKLVGILTNRDIRNLKTDSDKVSTVMTPRENLIVLEVSKDMLTNEELVPNAQKCKNLMLAKHVEKIPIVSDKNEVLGLVTLKDILSIEDLPFANKDREGKLYVGAAIGAKDDYLERAKALVDSGCDVLVIDVANGHSQICIDAVERIKEQFPKTDVVAGSIATGDGAERLIKVGADGIRCGIGNGSICITRIVAGSGVPQFTALMDVAPICKQYQIPLISDGGNRNSGNMCKALAIGADCVMLGRLLGGCEESPSKVIYRDGKLQKVFRGMAGYGANVAKAQRLGINEPTSTTFTPEGVEGYIPYAGPLKDVINQFLQGIRSGMSYTGAKSMKELQQKAKFIRMTQSGFRESGVHDISKI